MLGRREATTGEPRDGRMTIAGEQGGRNPSGQTGTAILPGCKTYLIGSYVDCIYRPGVRNGAGEFSSS